MALVLADRVKETTTTTGTGTITLSGAVSGFRSFSIVGDGNTTYYTISGQGTSEWEVGIGTYTASGTTLSRDTVLASSAGAPTKTTFSSGTKDVFVTYPAGRSVYVDGVTVDTAGMGATQGDILYASGADEFSRLAKNTTATRYLANTGTNNNPAWSQIDLSNGVTGTLPSGNGGTGQTTYTNGQLLIGNTTGNTLTKATLTAGTGISITNGAGSISIASTATGTVTSVSGTGTASGLTLSGTVTTSGSLTLSGTATVASLTTASGSAPSYSARAWVNFSGTGTVAIRASGNVSSITDNGTGDYTVNFTTAMSDANYAVNAISQQGSGDAAPNGVVALKNAATITTSAVRLIVGTPTVGANDRDYVFVSIFR